MSVCSVRLRSEKVVADISVITHELCGMRELHVSIQWDDEKSYLKRCH